MTSKYVHICVGVKNLKPGAGICFLVTHPWGLADYVYKTYVKTDKTLHVRVAQKKGMVFVRRSPDWKKIDLRKVL